MASFRLIARQYFVFLGGVFSHSVTCNSSFCVASFRLFVWSYSALLHGIFSHCGISSFQVASFHLFASRYFAVKRRKYEMA